MFECMGISESVYEDDVETCYKDVLGHMLIMMVSAGK